MLFTSGIWKTYPFCTAGSLAPLLHGGAPCEKASGALTSPKRAGATFTKAFMADDLSWELYGDVRAMSFRLEESNCRHHESNDPSLFPAMSYSRRMLQFILKR